MKRKLFYFFLIILYEGIIFYLSSQPVPPGIQLKGIDKLLHIIEYLPLGFLWALLLKEMGLRGWMIFAFIFSILYAISDEIHQLFVPGRLASVSDIFADGIGITLGIYIRYRWRR